MNTPRFLILDDGPASALDALLVSVADAIVVPPCGAVRLACPVLGPVVLRATSAPTWRPATVSAEALARVLPDLPARRAVSVAATLLSIEAPPWTSPEPVVVAWRMGRHALASGGILEAISWATRVTAAWPTWAPGWALAAEAHEAARAPKIAASCQARARRLRQAAPSTDAQRAPVEEWMRQAS